MKLYNSLSKSVEEFKPLNETTVNMYVCGITPYDTTHLGHAFTYVYFDTLIRFLRYKGYKITYTQNVTDINDRDNDILKRAKEQGVPWQNLATFWTDKFLEDMHSLNWVMPDHFLWASAHIRTMIDLISRLLKNNNAYEINGGVYLDIKKKRDFGELSGYDEEKMLRVANEFDEDTKNTDKRHPLDITLWRPTAKGQSKHIPSFDSPFGPGRPGWHLECSAMAISSLGEQIDIHGGGIDLIYPHHESEIAQSEAGTGKVPFSKYWIHTQLVSYRGKKMSKSLGNLILISDLLEKYSANAIRFLLLSNHYRTPWEFFETELIEAEKKINILKSILSGEYQENNTRTQSDYMKNFEKAMDDDMNTPDALEIMLNTKNKEGISKMADVLGFKF